MRKSFNHLIRFVLFSSLTLGATIIVSDSVNAVSQVYSVTFHNNVPGTADSSVIQSSSAPTALKAFSTMGFSYPNYYFADWSTQQNGGGVIYQDQASYPFSADVELYAQWVQVSHSVAFFSNLTNTDTSHATQTNNAPATLTSFSALSFLKDHYSFVNWNTLRDGTGISFQDQSTYSFNADLQLFAQWTPDQYNVSFSSNSGTGSLGSISSAYGATVTLPQGGSLSKPGYQLTGWNTDPQGTGTEYSLGSSITVLSNETLYAQWSQQSFVVSLDPGQNLKLTPIVDPAGKAVVLRLPVTLARPGFTFLGWYSAPSGGTLLGKNGGLFTPVKSVTLYAHWVRNPLVSLEFSGNGGVGHMAAKRVRAGLAVTIPTDIGLRRTGYSFRGWATNPHSSVPTLRIGTTMVLTHVKVLYALWRHEPSSRTPQVLLGSVGIFAPNSSALTPKMRSFIRSLAGRINAHNQSSVVIYGYATSMDSKKESASLSLQRANAVEKNLNLDLVALNDVGVSLHVAGEGRLSNSVLASFRNVEIFAR